MSQEKQVYMIFQFIQNSKPLYETRNIIDFFKDSVENKRQLSVAKSKNLSLVPGEFEFIRAGEVYPFPIITGKIGFESKKDIDTEVIDPQSGKVINKKIVNDETFGVYCDFFYRDDLRLLGISVSKKNVITAENILYFFNHSLSNFLGKELYSLKHIAEKEILAIMNDPKNKLKQIIAETIRPNPIKTSDEIKKEYNDTQADKIKKVYTSNKYSLIFSQALKESFDFIEHGYGNYKIVYKDQNSNNHTVSFLNNIKKIKINVSSKKEMIDDFIQKTNNLKNEHP